MVVGLCKMLSPILAFTADEAWEFVPGKTVASVHQLGWQPAGFKRPEGEESRPGRGCWKFASGFCRIWRRSIQPKNIGKALEARLTLSGSTPALVAARANEDALRELLNVSQLEITDANEVTLRITVSKAAGQKCERCWHWETDVGSHPEHPTICSRCVKAVQESTPA